MQNISLIGIGIIVIGFLISLNPYLLIVAVPVFLIGAVILLLSNSSRLRKTLWTIVPLILWYPAMFLFMALLGIIGTATTQKLDFIFKEGFEGKVMIVSDRKCGQKVFKVDGREQLVIPENGVLLYQGKVKPGYINHGYYFESDEGMKIEIPERADHMYWEGSSKHPNKSIVGIWVGGMGTKHINLPKPEVEFKYLSLTVSSADSIGKYSEFHYSKNFEALSDSLVQECEKN